MTGGSKLFHGLELPLKAMNRNGSISILDFNKIKDSVLRAMGDNHLNINSKIAKDKDKLKRIKLLKAQHAKIIAFINYLFTRINSILNSNTIAKLTTFFKRSLVTTVQKIQLQNIINYTHTLSRP